ncbi:hypothetical protein Anas_03518 [Armadillidium nasatum]|uniref:Uncharacterized protein n=1 Tax=Armadillidium nasatum TaxID=96803 RepID=A0A5N5TBS5_9CRUS|nr:hypothetical protein Anas_03518 [Armadillidium nasatum]
MQINIFLKHPQNKRVSLIILILRKISGLTLNPSYASVDSSSCQKSLSHYNDSKESSQNLYTSDPKVNLDSGKGDFERECENFIFHCRTMGNKKESRTTESRSNSYSGSSPVCSEKRSRSPSTKHHKSYSQERNPKRVRASSSTSRHHKVKKSKKKRVKYGNSSVSPSKSRDYHNQHFSWFSSDSDTDNEKYVKLYKSIEKTALKTIIKEISKIFDRSSGSKEEALKCLRELHKMEFVEYRKNPEFHPLYSLEKKRWDGHMKEKGFDLHHQAVEREWNKYFNVILEKSFVDSWAKKEKKLLKKFLQNSKNKSSVKTHSYSSAIKPDSRHRDSSFSREKEADKRLPGNYSRRKPSSSPSSKEKRYHSRDHYRDSSTKKRDRELDKNSKSSKYSSEAKTIRKNREESKAKDKQPLRVKQSPQRVRKRNSEKLYSSHSSCKDQIPTYAENYNKDLPLKQNPSRKKYEDTKKIDKIVSNYVKKDPHEADTNKEGQSSKTLVPKQSVSVKSRLTFIGSSKPSLKDRLYIPWETKEEKFIGIPMADIPQVNRESSKGITPSTIRVELQTKGDNIGSNERVARTTLVKTTMIQMMIWTVN